MCATILVGRWDDRLEALWPRVLEAVPDPDRAHLEAEQGAWLAHRDAACRFAVARVEGGSLAAHAGGTCRTAMTAERVAHFLGILGTCGGPAR